MPPDTDTNTAPTPPVVHEYRQATEGQLWRAFLSAGYEPALRPIGGGKSVTRRRWRAWLHLDDNGRQIESTGPVGYKVGEAASRKVALRKLLNSLVDTGLEPLEVWRSIDPRMHGNPRAVEREGAESIRRRSYSAKLLAVLSMIDERGPITDRDLEHHLGWPMGTGAKRRHELALDGIVERTGDSAIAWTGHRGDTWVITNLGTQILTDVRAARAESSDQ